MADVIISDCGNWDVTWPYPQVFFGDYYTLAFAVVSTTSECSVGLPVGTNHLVLFELTNSTNVWTAAARYDLGSIAYIDQIDVMDFGQFYTVTTFGYNSETPVITGCRRNPGATPPLFTALSTTNSPKFITGCNYNGQAIIGGIISTDANWSALGLPGVAWSSIGYFDFRPKEEFGVAGFRRMPWENNGSGIVYKILKLGKGVLVLGDGGQAYLYPASSGDVVTFGMRELPGTGIRSGNHAAGDEHNICFIDRNYDLWIITADLKLTKLGYREYMKALITYSGVGDSRVLMSYVPEHKCFYISNGYKCYILTEFGLYTTDQITTSIGDYRGVLCGFWKDGEDPEFRLTTDRLDFGSQGLKTIEGVEFGVHYNAIDAKLSADINYLYDYADVNFSSLGWTDVNPLGQLSRRITAKEFQIKLKGTTYKEATFNLDSCLVRVKYPDKRNIRGILSSK